MEKDIAIKVEGVSKTFRIPHEKVTSLRGAAINAFKKNSYEEFKALDDVSFEVKKGEFFGIIGRNGSGKSTLLKILAGIYQTDKGKGKVHINGRISPFLELGIGFNMELSGRDNVYLNAIVLGMTKKQVDKKFDSIVAFSELERFIDQKLKNYSSGMQVRLAFAVSIHANREILLMDEVLAVGDTNFQQKCLAEFSRYRETGKTVILVSHDITTAQKYCDRLMLLRNGKIKMIGDPQEVGNEYMDQNITDQCLNVKESDDDKLTEIDNEQGLNLKRRAEILEYRIIDHKNKESLNLESGKLFKIHLKIKFNENISNPTIGVMFKDFSNSIDFGIHSLFSRNPFVFKDVNPGDSYEIVFEDEMILVPGVYNVSIFCSNQRSHYEYEPLDMINNLIKVRVYSDGFFWGMINSGAHIDVKKIN